MLQSRRSPGKYACLVQNYKSRTRKVINRSVLTLAIVTLCAVGIWIFTPVSEEADYKPDQLTNAIQLNPGLSDVAPMVSIQLPASKPGKAENYQMAGIQVEKGIFADGHDHAIISPIDANSLHQLGTEAMATDNHPTAAEKSLVLQTFEFDTIDESPDMDFQIAEANKVVVADKPAEGLSGRVESFTIKSGDTLTRIFSRAKLPISQAIRLAKTEQANQLNNLSIGKVIRIFFDRNNQWETLEYDLDRLNTLVIAPKEGEFQVSQHEKVVEYRNYSAYGLINSSLSMAAEKAGISPAISRKLVDVFKWEIDFARDLQSGDTFSVVYQKAFIEDELIADGEILAASFTSEGRTIEAIRYTDSSGTTSYFQPDGESLRRGFLRTPVKLARITSGFGKRRHPIKKTWKKHLGVDYGARKGTPILATADGVVQYSGKKGGYGNTVILRHGGIYTTLYAHMSNFGKGIRSGKSVSQGQVIGYVGRSGWATGDHLHYEFRVNGQHKNPLKIDLPRNAPLAKREMPAFNNHAEPLLDTLTTLKTEEFASTLPEKDSTQPTL